MARVAHVVHVGATDEHGIPADVEALATVVLGVDGEHAGRADDYMIDV
ncbi:MAG: hypothetical protein WCF36_11195 [Candidatus Nanopelagicales bacterium]